MKFDRKEFLTRIARLEEKIDEDRREVRKLYDYVVEIEEIPDFDSRETHQEEADLWLEPKQVSKCLGMSKSTFYAQVKNGDLPPGRRFSPRKQRWRMSDIEAWQNGERNGSTVNIIINEPQKNKRRGRPSKIRRKEEFI